MRGSGTKLDTTSHEPPARLLDVSRLISRAGRPLTGVDRVELAYLEALSARPEPLFTLIRSRLGYILIGPDRVGALTARIRGDMPWGSRDLLSGLSRRTPALVLRAEADARRLALARCRPMRLNRMLARSLPPGTAYVNVGHSNLTDRVFWAVRHGMKGRAAVMIHDTIPLDYPQYQRPGSPDRFRALLRRVLQKADVILCNSAYTEDRVRYFAQDWSTPKPDTLVAHLGVEVPSDVVPEAANTPYFICLGTIEPRKNHALLLDVWEEMASERPADALPRLLICGARGWNNKAVFDRLDALPPGGPVQEMGPVQDARMMALMAGASGLLFPSFAEGYGLPPMEAAALGVPVIAAPLPSLREVMQEFPVYVMETDRYSWKQAVTRLAEREKKEQSIGERATWQPPTWQDHFKIVLRYT